MGKDFLEIARRNLTILEKTATSEQDVKRLIVEPVMIWAGIDIYDPNILREEYRIDQVNHTTHADYAIFESGKVKIAVEAKKIKENLENSLKQLIDYCNYGRIRFGLITNGYEWWFVDEMWRSSKSRVFLTINLDSDKEYTLLLKLINPNFMETLSDLADGLEETEGLKKQKIYREILLKKTAEKLKKIESQKMESEADRGQINGKPVTLAEFLDFMSKENDKDLRGMEPPESAVINGKKIKVKYWNDIFVEFIRSSYKKIPIPFKVSERAERYVINTESIHSNGKAMMHPLKIESGIYVETNYSFTNIFKIVKKIKEVLNLPDDYIKFPADWFKKAKLYVEERKRKNARS